MKILEKTQSVCPECNRLLDAEIFERDGKVYIRKTCPEHGYFEDLYWGDIDYYNSAKKFARDGKGIENPNVKKKDAVCPFDCGLCPLHKSGSNLTNIVVTNRCDLNCWYCFFYAEKAGYVYEPTLEQIREMARVIRAERPVPGNAIQITGGEPTIRDDLIDIIKIFKEEGFSHVQLNTNGIKMSQDPNLAKAVREAGVNNLYLSFDGVTAKTNPKNHWEAPKVIENCRKADLGIVLVPTVIKTVNDNEIGDILKFAFDNMDVVRGVNYQPVSLVGQMPRKERDKFRITIPDVLNKLEEQTDGQVTKEDFFPIPTELPLSHFVEAITKRPQYELSAHFACGAASYIFKDGDKMIPISRFLDVPGITDFLEKRAQDIQAGKSKIIAGARLLARLGSFIDNKKKPSYLNFKKMLFDILIKHNYGSLAVMHKKALFVGMMHFMDKYNYDVERVKRCVIHYVTPDKQMPIIPFCTFNVFPELYRDKIQKKYSISFKEWEKKTGKKLKDDLYHRDLSKFKESN